MARTAHRRRTGTDAVELPGLSAVVPDPEPALPVPPDAPKINPPDVVVEVLVEPDVVETGTPEPAPLIAPATPKETEALSEALDAQTPLLRRAFSNVVLPDDS